MPERSIFSLEYGYYYLYIMGVLGILLVTLTSTLHSLANNIGLVSTDCGSVFLSRGFGSFLGSLLGIKIYEFINGKYVVILMLVVLNIILGFLPYNTKYEDIVASYFFLGMFTSIAEYGCLKLTRFNYKMRSGPWLGLYNITFGVFGSIVPLLAIITSGHVKTQYAIINAFIAAMTAVFVLSPNAQTAQTVKGIFVIGSSQLKNDNRMTSDAALPTVYYAEPAVSLILFCVNGAMTSLTTFVNEYVVVNNLIGRGREPVLVLVFWITVTIGRFIGVIDQVDLTVNSLILQLAVLTFIGIIAMIIPICSVTTPAIWFGIVIYGFCMGPIPGFVNDLIARITYSSDFSFTFVLIGSNFGLTFVPFMTASIWNDESVHSMTFLIVLLVAMLLACMLTPLLLVINHKYYGDSVGRKSIFANEEGENQFWKDLVTLKDEAKVRLTNSNAVSSSSSNHPSSSPSPSSAKSRKVGDFINKNIAGADEQTNSL